MSSSAEEEDECERAARLRVGVRAALAPRKRCAMLMAQASNTRPPNPTWLWLMSFLP